MANATAQVVNTAITRNRKNIAYICVENSKRGTWLDVQTLETETLPRKGQTVSGYGKRMPTRHMIHIGNIWRRVYAASWSNSATLYIQIKGQTYNVNW